MVKEFTEAVYQTCVDSQQKQYESYTVVYVSKKDKADKNYERLIRPYEVNEEIAFYVLDPEQSKSLTALLAVEKTPALIVLKKGLPYFREPLPDNCKTIQEDRKKLYTQDIWQQRLVFKENGAINVKRFETLLKDMAATNLVFSIHRFLELYWDIFTQFKLDYNIPDYDVDIASGGAQKDLDADIAYCSQTITVIMELYRYAYCALDSKAIGMIRFTLSVPGMLTNAYKIGNKNKDISFNQYNIPRENGSIRAMVTLIASHCYILSNYVYIPKTHRAITSPLLSKEVASRLKYAINFLKTESYFLQVEYLQVIKKELNELHDKKEITKQDGMKFLSQVEQYDLLLERIKENEGLALDCPKADKQIQEKLLDYQQLASGLTEEINTLITTLRQQKKLDEQPMAEYVAAESKEEQQASQRLFFFFQLPMHRNNNICLCPRELQPLASKFYMGNQ